MLKNKFLQLSAILKQIKKSGQDSDKGLLLNAQQMIHNIKSNRIDNLTDAEFKVFSQWGDDGIIQWLVHNLAITSKTFIEFGVEDYIESNTRFLLMNNNWTGLIMDGSAKNIERIKNSYYYWMYDLTAKAAFVDAENIDDLIRVNFPHKHAGILHIDIDGNDYWIWKAISVLEADIVIIEYNSIFGYERAITVPYNKNFVRSSAHHSGIYYGTSLKALYELAKEKGYTFIGGNSAGNNAYFVKDDLINSKVKEVSLEDGFVASKFREARDEKGNLTFYNFNERLKLLQGLPVFNVLTNSIEPF